MRAQKELQLSESIPIDDAIRRTVLWNKTILEKQHRP
jgi:hypothetical protein